MNWYDIKLSFAKVQVWVLDHIGLSMILNVMVGFWVLYLMFMLIPLPMEWMLPIIVTVSVACIALLCWFGNLLDHPEKAAEKRSRAANELKLLNDEMTEERERAS